MLLAVGRNENLVEIPFAAELPRAPAEFVGEVASKFLRSAPNCFTADNDAARGEKIFDFFRVKGATSDGRDRGSWTS
jgi:hypothetical protein